MAIDIQKKMMFVFGGRVIEKKGSELAEGSWLSGLYFYKMQTNSWKRVQPDVRATRLKDHSFKPRVGHCMIFHPVSKICTHLGLVSSTAVTIPSNSCMYGADHRFLCVQFKALR